MRLDFKLKLEKRRDEGNPILYINTLINIRAVINQHLAEIWRDINIVGQGIPTDKWLFRVFWRRAHARVCPSLPQTIEKDDLEKIYQYFQGGAIESPVVLRHAVWYFLVIHFVTSSRGLEFHHQLRIDSFDGTGEFASLRHETLQESPRWITINWLSHIQKNVCIRNCSRPIKKLKYLIERTDN